MFDIPLDTPDGPAKTFKQKALYDRIMSRVTVMCPGYARYYLAWVNIPEKRAEMRKPAFKRLRDHAVVCGCNSGIASRDNNSWIFEDAAEPIAGSYL